MLNSDPANIPFKLAAAFVNQTNRHVFLTGKAGTGKTTFLKYIREHTFKKTAVAAPTGVAAINAGGVTLHSLLQLPLTRFVPTTHTGWDSGLLNRTTLLRQLKMSREKQDLLRELELLIIDEASMVRADLLDAADTVLRHVRRNDSMPFGGLQVLYIGDLYQLPPVVRDGEWEQMQEYYESPYFFDSLAAKETPLVYIELDTVYRQQDDTFVSILNNIRENTATSDDFEVLHRRYSPMFRAPEDEHYITLTTHNFKADQINQQQLAGLRTTPHSFNAEVEGEFGEHAYPAEKVLELKAGAQVMFTKNDVSEAKRYYNGKIGVIEKIQNKEIYVQFSDKSVIRVDKETWKNIRYVYDSEKDKVTEEELGAFRQYPLRLAWAVTIHKSQGLTFEKAIIDAGGAFAAGQVYVALSRLTSLPGLVLLSRIPQSAVFCDERIKKIKRYQLRTALLEEMLQQESRQYAAHLLLSAFNWQKPVNAVQEFYLELEGRQIPSKDKAIEWALPLVQQVNEQQNTAGKFLPVMEHLIYQCKQQDNYAPLHERVQKAVGYFSPLITGIVQNIEQHIKEYRIKPKTKKYIRDLYVMAAVFKNKHKHIQQAQAVTESLAGGGLPDYAVIQQQLTPAVAAAAMPEPEERGKKPAKGETQRISLAMFKEGKTVAAIAAERSLTAGTIEGHLATFISTGEVKITDLVTAEKMNVILNTVKEMGGVPSSAIKEKLGPEYSYGEIKAVLEHVKLTDKE
jgi:GTPase SAR1 family protein